MFRLHFYVLDSLTKIQKSSLVSYIKYFVKKNYTSSSSSDDNNDIYYKLLEDIEYDFAINYPRFPWIREYLDNEGFEKDIKNLITYIQKQLVSKEIQKPYIEKQKERAKCMKKKATEWRQSHEKPTRKQILYYNAICERKKIPKENLAEKSKLDLKNMIANLLENNTIDD